MIPLGDLVSPSSIAAIRRGLIEVSGNGIARLGSARGRLPESPLLRMVSSGARSRGAHPNVALGARLLIGDLTLGLQARLEAAAQRRPWTSPRCRYQPPAFEPGRDLEAYLERVARDMQGYLGNCDLPPVSVRLQEPQEPCVLGRWIPLGSHATVIIYHHSEATRAQLLATLAHEMTHDALMRARGIVLADEAANELLTDVAAVTFGLGEVLFAGRGYRCHRDGGALLFGRAGYLPRGWIRFVAAVRSFLLTPAADLPLWRPGDSSSPPWLHEAVRLEDERMQLDGGGVWIRSRRGIVVGARDGVIELWDPLRRVEVRFAA